MIRLIDQQSTKVEKTGRTSSRYNLAWDNYYRYDDVCLLSIENNYCMCTRMRSLNLL